LLVIGMETFSDIRELGSQSLPSVVRPVHSGIMPDLVCKTPTCINRDSSLHPHGKVGIKKFAVVQPLLTV